MGRWPIPGDHEMADIPFDDRIAANANVEPLADPETDISPLSRRALTKMARAALWLCLSLGAVLATLATAFDSSGGT